MVKKISITICDSDDYSYYPGSRVTGKVVCHAKSGPGKKWTPRSTFGRKNGPGGPLFSAKSGPALPKVDLVHLSRKKWTRSSLAGEKSGPGPVSLSNSKQVRFWQGKKVDPVQFRCQILSRSVFGRGKKWTRSSFAVKIQAGPFLAGEKSGPGPVSLSKSRQVHFWQGKKVDPVQFRCQNPGRSIFGRGKKWTRSSFAVKIQAGPFLAGEKSGPGPVSCRNPGRSIFGRGKKWTRSSFAVEIQAGPFLAGEKSGPGPVSCRNPGRSIFGRGKKWTRSSFLPKSRQVHFWQGKKVDPVPVSLSKSKQVHFWQGKTVDLVQFCC